MQGLYWESATLARRRRSDDVMTEGFFLPSSPFSCSLPMLSARLRSMRENARGSASAAARTWTTLARSQSQRSCRIRRALLVAGKSRTPGQQLKRNKRPPRAAGLALRTHLLLRRRAEAALGRQAVLFLLDLVGDLKHVAVGAVVHAAAVDVEAVELVDKNQNGDVRQGEKGDVLADGIAASA